MRMENQWSDAETKNLNTLEDILQPLDDVFEVLVSGDVIWAHQKIEKFKWMEVSLDRLGGLHITQRPSFE
jgi:hypothetical protein